MTRVLALMLILVASAATAADTSLFEARFVDETLRIDYNHTGHATLEVVGLDRVHRQGAWAGSRVHLVDDLDLGRYCAKLYDAEDGRLIFSRGFDSYFGEWRTTGPAAEGVSRTYHESVLAPFPKRPVVFALEARGSDGLMTEVYRTTIDPEDVEIRSDPIDASILVFDGHIGGHPHGCVDVAILGEGYTVDDVAKFEADLKRFSAALMGQEPFASMTDRFNVRGVLKPSQDRGCDEPTRGIHRNTSLGCTFNSLGSSRYMLTEDNRAIRDVAAAAPYDVLSIMVNLERYGGGGIYNLFNTFTSDNQWSDYVFVHEFGHGFAGLADEYYSSTTAYTDFYPPGVEPRERNITAMLDGAPPKWADLIAEGTPVPTPWNKLQHDAMDVTYQSRRGVITDLIAKLSRTGAPQDEIDEAKSAGEAFSRDHQDRLDAWFAENEAFGVVGAYEGAGYCSEGMYRAEIDCIMFSKGLKDFCAACARGIVEVAERYGE